MCVLPVDESVVQQEYGVIGRTLDLGHGAVHEDVKGVVHSALSRHRHACFWTRKTCRCVVRVKVTVTMT